MYSFLCRNLQRLISFIAFVVRLARSCMLHTVSKLRDPFIPKQGQNVLRNEVIDKGGTQIARVSGQWHPSLYRSFAPKTRNHRTIDKEEPSQPEVPWYRDLYFFDIFYERRKCRMFRENILTYIFSLWECYILISLFSDKHDSWNYHRMYYSHPLRFCSLSQAKPLTQPGCYYEMVTQNTLRKVGKQQGFIEMICDCCRSNQMPLTDQTTDLTLYVRT